MSYLNGNRESEIAIYSTILDYNYLYNAHIIIILFKVIIIVIDEHFFKGGFESKKYKIIL